MLVKIAPDQYVNTEHVVSVIISGSTAKVYLTGDPRVSFSDITLPAVAYLLEHMDAASAIVLPSESEYIDPDTPDPRPLTSRIAQLLRDSLINGATVDDLIEAGIDEEYNKIYTALASLITERVVINANDHDKTLDPLLYFHAAHAPRVTPPPALELEAFDAFIRNIAAGEFQCVECHHQSCFTCAKLGVCCQPDCDCPSFTPLLPTSNPDPSIVDAPLELCLPAADSES